MALVVLADLVETGVPVDRAVDVVREALDRRTADEDMLGLTARVRAAMRQGETAGAAAEGVRRCIHEGHVRRVPPGEDAVGPPAPPELGADGPGVHAVAGGSLRRTGGVPGPGADVCRP